MALELKQVGDLITVCDADLVPDGDKDTTYSIRHLTIEKNRELRRKHTKRKPNPRTHVMEDETDEYALSDEQFDYALADWKGVVAGGEAVPCTRDHKMLLDGLRRDAILRKAGLNEIAAVGEARKESFRSVA